MTTKKNKAAKAAQAGDQAPSTEKLVSILSGEVKDDFCNFDYLVSSGVGKGFRHKVVGKDVGVVLDDMHAAFGKFNVHMAVIDQVFHHKGINIENIDDYHNDVVTALYQVDSFQLKGEDEAQSVILKGTKSVGALGRQKITTPEIQIDNLSGYKWYNELKAAVEAAKREVEAYMNGKFTPVVKEEKEDPDQLDISDEIEAAEEETGK